MARTLPPHAASEPDRQTRRPTAVQNFSIVVANVNDAPVITGQAPNPIPLQQATALTITLGHLLVTDVDSPYPTGFTLTVLNGSNYTRSGNTITPTANFLGTLTVPVRVNDGAANSANFNLAVRVAAPATADLSLQVAATPMAALVNAEVEWRLTVTNAGPQPASSAELTAEFAGNPFGFAQLSSCTVTPAADRQRLNCTLPTVGVGASASVSVTLMGAAAQDGDVFVAASVRPAAGTPNDPNPANDTATATLHVAQTLSGSEAQRLAGPDHAGAAAGDVNGDGFADIVLAKTAGGAAAELYLNVVDGDSARRRLAAMPLLIGTSAVYLNQGASGFSRAADLGADDSQDVVALDFDLDGLPDLVFANANGPSRFYRNLGAGGAPLFVLTRRIGAAPTAHVLAADLDGDGTVDVVTLNTTGTHQVYRGDGAGGLALHPVQFTWAGATGAVLAKLSVDSAIDLAIAGATSSAVFFNDGRGGLGLGDTMVPVLQLLGAPAVTVTVGDTQRAGRGTGRGRRRRRRSDASARRRRTRAPVPGSVARPWAAALRYDR